MLNGLPGSDVRAAGGTRQRSQVGFASKLELLLRLLVAAIALMTSNLAGVMHP